VRRKTNSAIAEFDSRHDEIVDLLEQLCGLVLGIHEQLHTTRQVEATNGRERKQRKRRQPVDPSFVPQLFDVIKSRGFSTKELIICAPKVPRLQAVLDAHGMTTAGALGCALRAAARSAPDGYRVVSLGRDESGTVWMIERTAD
jgi:hypothetical protein